MLVLMLNYSRDFCKAISWSLLNHNNEFSATIIKHDKYNHGN